MLITKFAFLIVGILSVKVESRQFALQEGDDAPAAPIWPETFTVDFQEKSKLNPFGKFHETRGQYFYDSVRGASLVTRENGRHDRYCGSVKPFQDTSCNHLTVNGRRYLVFPEKKYCCYCCADRHGCGIMRRDWLKGAKYLGQETCSQNEKTMCYKWDQPGLQSNFYWEETESHIPRRIFQSPNDDQTFNPKTFSDSAISSDKFHLPEYCYDSGNGQVLSCPTISACTLVRRALGEK